jgi:hypothetical protein
MSSNQSILEHPGPPVSAKASASAVRRLLGFIIAGVLLLAAVSMMISGYVQKALWMEQLGASAARGRPQGDAAG